MLDFLAFYPTMASSFIGYTVLVTLKTPPNAQIRGIISNVTGQRLTLQDGITITMRTLGNNSDFF